MANSLTDAELTRAREQLANYSYTLSDEGRFIRGDGKPLSVVVRARRGRFVAVAESGDRLWAGGDLAHFVRGFWHAEPTQ